MWELFVRPDNGSWELYGRYKTRGTAIGLSSRLMNRGGYDRTIVINQYAKGDFEIEHIRREVQKGV